MEDNDKDDDNNKDDKNDKGISSLGPPQKAHCATTKIQISQLWDFIETWDFRKDLKPIVFSRLSGGPFHVIEAESINGFRIPAYF